MFKLIPYHSATFENIKKVALKTDGSNRPFGLDANDMRRSFTCSKEVSASIGKTEAICFLSGNSKSIWKFS